MGNSTLPLGGGDTSRLAEIILQPGHTFVTGDVIRVDETTPGEYVLAQANTAANAEAVGIVESVAGTSFEVVYQGRVNVSTVAWTDLPFLVTGEVWFLSDTVAGELTRTPPSTAGTVIKAMLVISDPTGGSEEGVLTGYVGVQIGGDNTVNLGEIQPLGTILPWAASAATPAPTGWALCDGQELDRTTFVELFNLIGTDYGVGDGSTTFNIPDMQRRVPVGQEPGGDVDFDDVGDSGGEKDHTLTVGELPDHSHDHDTLPVFDPGAGTPYTAVVVPPGPPLVPVGSLPGGGAAHNNMPPFLVINFIIRTTEQAAAAILDHNLTDHTDVDAPAPNDCDIIKFNSVTGNWESEQQFLSDPNRLINGQFDVWQRDTSFIGPVLPAQFNVDQYTADRWIWTLDDDGGQVSTVLPAQFNQQLFVAGQTEVPRNPTFFIRGDGIVIAGGTGSEFSDIQQRIEDVNTFSGETATLSFYARSSETTPSLMISLQQFFGLVGASAPLAVQPQVISLSGTWQRFVITFNVPSVSGKTITAGNALRVRFANIVGPTVAASLSVPVVDTAQFDLANVQFEIGSLASPFEKKFLATEIALCQRYFAKNQNINTVPSAAIGPGRIVFQSAFAFGNGTLFYPTRMRANPTLVFFNTGPSGAFVSVGNIGESSAEIQFASAPFATWDFNYTADAEL